MNTFFARDFQRNFVVFCALVLGGLITTPISAGWSNAGQVGGAQVYRDSATNLEWTVTMSRVGSSGAAQQTVANLGGFRLPTHSEFRSLEGNGGIQTLRIDTDAISGFYWEASGGIVNGNGGNFATLFPSSRFHIGDPYTIGVRPAKGNTGGSGSGGSGSGGSSSGGKMAIVGIKVKASTDRQWARTPNPEWGSGYKLLDKDLNSGQKAGSPDIYIFYKKSTQGQPISDLTIVTGDPVPGYTKIPVNLNQGTNGDSIYLCYIKNPAAKPVTSLTIAHQDSNVANSTKINVNLNRGSGKLGENIFLWYGKQ